MKTVKFILGLLIAFNVMHIKEAPGQEQPVGGLTDSRLTGGNVGIGTNNPAEKLHLEGGNFLIHSVNPFIFLDNTYSAGATGLAFKYNGNWKGWLYYNEDLDHVVINAEEGAGYRPDIVIKSNGFVGIGTSSPGYKFQVEGDMVLRDYYPFLHIDNTDLTGNAGLIFKTNGAIKGYLYYDDYNDHLLLNAESGSRPDIIIKPGGNVGIGSSSPSAKLHVVGTFPGYTGIFGIPVSPWSLGTNVSVGNTGEDAALYVGQVPGYTGYLWWDYNSAPANASFRIGTFNGSNPLYLQPHGGGIRVGDPDSSPNSLFEVYYDSNTMAQLGYGYLQGTQFYHREVPANGDGQAAIYGYRTRLSQNDGETYTLGGSNSSIKGYCFWGDLRSFGVSGFNDNDHTRCGGVLGAHTYGSYWGSLGYENSAGNYFGGYFTSTGTGGGKSHQPAYIGIGLGAWGDLIGADIHGKIYGTYTEGENYALFANGTVFKNDLDVHLQASASGSNTVLYTGVSTAATVQTCGTAVLTGGRASISFDPAFTAAVSTVEPVVVTVTPVGNSNGVYVSEVAPDGFRVIENNEGRSNVTINYIAIGRRAGYENPTLPPELLDGQYVDKLSRGLHDDGDNHTDGEGLYYEGGQLVVGVHPSTLPDPDKPAEAPFNFIPPAAESRDLSGSGKTAGGDGIAR